MPCIICTVPSWRDSELQEDWNHILLTFTGSLPQSHNRYLTGKLYRMCQRLKVSVQKRCSKKNSKNEYPMTILKTTTKIQKFSARGILLVLVFKNQFSEILHYYWTTFTTVFLPRKEYKHYKFLEERNFI